MAGQNTIYNLPEYEENDISDSQDICSAEKDVSLFHFPLTKFNYLSLKNCHYSLDLAMDILKDGILTLIQELVKHSATLAALEIETILLESRNVKLLVYNQTLLITIIKKTTGPNIGPIITSITNMTPLTLQQVRILTISSLH